MTTFQHAEQVWQTFPALAAGVIVCDQVDRPTDVESVIAEQLAIARQRLDQASESEFLSIQAWRRAYTTMGLKPTQYRCAAEALLRRLRTHGEQPRLHPLVDLCNAISAAHAIPIAVFDLDRVDGNLAVRPAIGTEVYRTFAGDIEHPSAGEIIYADDARHAHSRRWVTRQSGLSGVTAQTRRVLIVAEAVHQTAAYDVAVVMDTIARHAIGRWQPSGPARLLSAADPAVTL